MTTEMEIKEAAEDQRLNVIEITHAINSYPQGLGDIGVIGFDTYEEAEEFKRENDGGEIGMFQTRDGWHFWHYKGYKFESFDLSDWLSDNENWNLASDVVDEEAVQGMIMQMDADDRPDYLDKIAVIKKEMAEAPSGHVVVVNVNDDLYSETKPVKMMKYSFDTHTYAIGVYYAKDEFEAEI